MRVKFAITSLVFLVSAVFAGTAPAAADGCSSTKTDSNGRSCTLRSETVTTCLYWNDSSHCSGGQVLPVISDS